MSELNDKKIEVEIVETNTIKAEISIQEIKDVMFEEMHHVLDRLSIYHDTPSLDYNGGDENIEVYICGLDDYASASDIINDVSVEFEKAFAKYIKKISQESKEEGENGVL